MNRQKRAVADVAVNILANIAVVGAGLALYEQKWWCLLVAGISAVGAGWIAWRVNK